MAARICLKSTPISSGSAADDLIAPTATREPEGRAEGRPRVAPSLALPRHLLGPQDVDALLETRATLPRAPPGLPQVLRQVHLAQKVVGLALVAQQIDGEVGAGVQNLHRVLRLARPNETQALQVA
eukprot:13091090-Alexandrium_andersonii.AAC.1